jgi:hypothetical protein
VTQLHSYTAAGDTMLRNTEYPLIQIHTPSDRFYMSYNVHYGKLLKKRITNAPVAQIFFSHVFAPTCFDRHSTIIRVLDTVWRPYGTLTYKGHFNIKFLIFQHKTDHFIIA